MLFVQQFIEIDHVHEEMLRKKEEQDREKPQRQLFCFPHMGMWTKLWPDIWNFLDRVSKIWIERLLSLQIVVSYMEHLIYNVELTTSLYAKRWICSYFHLIHFVMVYVVGKKVV